MGWSETDIPDLTGKRAIVTGANSGIGLETARALAQKGAHVVIACRSPERGAEAVRAIEATRPRGRVELQGLDLGSLTRVEAYAKGELAAGGALDLLVANAGVMVPPLGHTAEGFELQFGTNHLAHFALVGRLYPKLAATPGSRIVVVSSMVHHRGRIDFGNFKAEKGYRAWAAYSQSKLANLLFALELDRRVKAAEAGPKAVAAHPGWTATNLQANVLAGGILNALFAQSPAMGALPTLRAATDPAVQGGEYFGPDGWLGWTGSPVPARISATARDPELAARLWAVSEELSGVRFLSR